MQKIVPHLWFDKEAVEAAAFYTSVFPDSKVTLKTEIKNTPSGDCDIVGFTLMEFEFMSISAGTLFRFNPSISFLVVSKSKDEVDEFWTKLSRGGKVLMELGEYPFSKRYGWTTDRYGLSWQVMLADEHHDIKQKITPTLMFVGNVCGKAAEAMEFYASVFPDGQVGDIAHYPAGMEPDREGTVMHGAVTLAGKEFFVMDSAREHGFSFNEAVSLLVNCKDQEEIDYYWEKLSAVPESEQCGWLKDKYGVSWQIVPENMGELMSRNPEKTTPAMLQMKKIVIADLEKAGSG